MVTNTSPSVSFRLLRSRPAPPRPRFWSWSFGSGFYRLQCVSFISANDATVSATKGLDSGPRVRLKRRIDSPRTPAPLAPVTPLTPVTPGTPVLRGNSPSRRFITGTKTPENPLALVKSGKKTSL